MAVRFHSWWVFLGIASVVCYACFTFDGDWWSLTPRILGLRRTAPIYDAQARLDEIISRFHTDYSDDDL